MNKSDTEVEFDIRFIASPNKLEIDNTSIFLTFFTLLELSIVSVITKFFIRDFLIFSTASPLKTPCVIYTWTSFAPLLIYASAALTIVPPESIMSSIIMHVLFFTFPITFIT